MVFAWADAAEHELFGDLDRQFGAVGLGDQVEHQVDGGRTAGAGDAAAIDLEQLLGHGELWIRFLEGVDGFPVQGQAVAVEQAGFGEDAGAGVDGAEGHAVVVEAAQPVFQRGGGELQRFEARDHQQGRAFFQRFQRGVGVDRHAIARQHRAAIGAQHVPAVQLATKAVGHPQRFQRGDKADGREARHQQKVEILGHGGALVGRAAWHCDTPVLGWIQGGRSLQCKSWSPPCVL